jgi:polyketide biosynthesis acyl carrier protein
MKDKVVNLIKSNLEEIIPELEGHEISADETLVSLGANSLDRGELITLTLERLGLDVPRIEFARAQTINELADLFTLKMQAN